MIKRIIICLLVLSLLPCALAADGLEEWVSGYNAIADEIGAPLLKAANATKAADGSYEFKIRNGLWFGVMLSPEGKSQAVFAQAFDSEDVLLSLMTAAAVMTDSSVQADQARKKLETLLANDTPINMDMTGKYTYLVARDKSFGIGVAVYDAGIEGAFDGSSALPAISDPSEDGESDFWDGLWEDDGAKDSPAPTAPPASKPTDKVIHKI